MVELTGHSIERFRERCRPALDFAAAKRELKRLVASHAVVDAEPPEWFAGRARMSAEAFIVISEEIVLPVRTSSTRYAFAVTCVTRTGLSDKSRAYRNGKAQRHRAYKRRARSDGRGKRRRPRSED
jgi:hypothetical protein